MTTDRDITGVVRSWLEEGVTAMPDRVLEFVIEQLPQDPSAPRPTAGVEVEHHEHISTGRCCGRHQRRRRRLRDRAQDQRSRHHKPDRKPIADRDALAVTDRVPAGYPRCPAEPSRRLPGTASAAKPPATAGKQ